MRRGVIYRITNLLNGKEYYGQTVNADPIQRWYAHCSKCRTSAVNLAIQKYGKANFKFEIICSAKSIEDLNYLEQYFIAKYQTLAPTGYNLDIGGRNCLKSKESIEKGNIKRRLKIFKDRRRGIIATHSENGHIIETEIVKDFLNFGFTKNDLSNIRWVLTGKGSKKRVKKYFFKYRDQVNQSLIVEDNMSTAAQRLDSETE